MTRTEQIINEFYQGKATKLKEQRIRFPKINLNSEYISELEKQIADLKKEGMSDKIILQRMQKALEFFV